MYYDIEREGIVFPYYFLDHFCGAQIRFLNPKTNHEGEIQKIDTLPGTRLGMLFGLWNQGRFITNVRAVGVCEGYFNALALQQAFNIKYGGVVNNPWKFICTSGCNVTKHHQEVLQELSQQNIKVIGAYDADEPGREGLSKMVKYKCITHYSSTLDDEMDWNDVLKSEGHEALAERFLKNLSRLQ
jgi:DNA primase